MKNLYIRLDDSNIYETTHNVVLEPLGLEYLISNANSHNFDICDLNNKETLPNFNDYDFVCITIPTPLYNQAKGIIKQIKEAAKCKIVVGGPHPTIKSEECISDLGADYVVVGEGEGLDFNKIKDERIIKLNKIDNLDNITMPYRYNVGAYKTDMGQGYVPTATVLTTRSCPYKCVFCSNKLIFGNKLRFRSVNNVMREINYLYDNGIRNIMFLDDTFTVDRNRVLDFCNKVKKLNMKWWIDTRVDKVDKELLMIMKNAGCSVIVFGVESGNQEILNRINKSITLEQVKNAVSWVNECGIESKANFMLGHYKETRQQMYDTINFATSIKTKRTGFYQVIPLPGTQLENYYKANSTDEYDMFKYYSKHIPTICDPEVNSDELKSIQKMAYEAVK